jgi:phenylacetic acid degradation operon negative regulatory protein
MNRISRQTDFGMDPRSKLIPPSIARKLDTGKPGAEEFLHDLEAVSLPRFQVGFPPQRLVMTLLGDFWAGRAEALPSAALVRLLGAFDINEQAARMTVGRLAQRGALILERRGRTTWYRQSKNLLTVLPQGRAITANFAEPRRWGGTWSVLTWSIAGGSAAVGYRIRTSLRELGFAPLGTGVWVSPDEPNEDVAKLFLSFANATYTLFSASDAEASGSESPLAAWDLTEIRSEHDAFLKLFRPALKRKGAISPSQAFALRTRVIYRWFVIATLDPDLPAELLPSNWPRVAARQLFVDLVDRYTLEANNYVRSVIAEFAPELEPLVTLPLAYGSARGGSSLAGYWTAELERADALQFGRETY